MAQYSLRFFSNKLLRITQQAYFFPSNLKRVALEIVVACPCPRVIVGPDAKP